MEQNDKLKKAIGIAAAFVGWMLITIFIMIGLFQLTTTVLGWNPYAVGILFVIVWLIMLIAPPVMIFSYMEPERKKDDDDD